MQRSETEPFPAFVDQQSEPFPIYDGKLVGDKFDPYESPFLGRPPPPRESFSLPRPSQNNQRSIFESLSLHGLQYNNQKLNFKTLSPPRPPHNNQRHIFESFPDYDLAPRIPSYVDDLSSDEDENSAGSVPVRVMSKMTMPHLDSPLKLANMQYSGGPYVNFWEINKTYRACVNGKDVTHGNVFEQSPLEQEQNEIPLKNQVNGKVKNKLSKIVSAIYRRQNSAEVEQEVQHEQKPKHDPRVIYDDNFATYPGFDADYQLQTKFQVRDKSNLELEPKLDLRIANGETGLEKQAIHTRSFSIKSVSQNISRRLARPEPDYRDRMLGLAEQPFPVPNLHCLLPKDRVSSINHWVATLAANIPDDERQENFVALTTAELIGIGGADIDGIEIVKKYYAPQNSPVPEATGLGEVEDIFEEDEQRPRRKDLIEYLGGVRNSGFHLVSMMDISGSTFDDPMNLSDCYRIPLIEPDNAYCLNSSEDSYSNGSKKSSISSTASFLNGVTYTDFRDPRRYLTPSHSLILYLHGKGHSLDSITTLLSGLDRTWLFEHQNRWFKNLRIPDLDEFSDELVTKIKEECKRGVEYWETEGAMDSEGSLYPSSWKFLMKEQRGMQVRRLVESVVESHFWSKLTGRRPVPGDDSAGGEKSCLGDTMCL